MRSRVHPKYKTRYCVGNWRAYERALVQRGDVTLWLSADARDAWRPSPSGHPGGQKRFSDVAITTALTLRLVFRLPLRQAEGFLQWSTSSTCSTRMRWGRPTGRVEFGKWSGCRRCEGETRKFWERNGAPGRIRTCDPRLRRPRSRSASSRLSRTLISARPPPRDEEMTPLGVRALSRLAVDGGEARAGRPSRPRFPSGGAGRVFGHDAGPHARFEAVAGGGTSGLVRGTPHRLPSRTPSRYATSCAPGRERLRACSPGRRAVRPADRRTGLCAPPPMVRRPRS